MVRAGISPPWLSSLSLSLLPPLVLALTPGWSSAFQSGSGNIRRAPRTFPIITGYTGELTHITLQCPLLYGESKYTFANGTSINVWSTICSEPELPGITITSGIKALSTIIPVQPVSRSTFTGRPFNFPTPT